MQTQKHIVLGITGASGGIYAQRLAEVLTELNHHVSVIFTETGRKVTKFENCYDPILKACFENFSDQDLFAPIASGSVSINAMVILPCSMGTLGKIAHGIGSGLLCRTADVQLKEKRTLIIVPRETPLHRTHLENMLKVHDTGAIILPPSPHFYQHPKNIYDLIDTIVSRILDHLQINHSICKPWRSE